MLRSFLEDLGAEPKGEAWEPAWRPLEEASVKKRHPTATMATKQSTLLRRPVIFDAPSRLGDTVTGRPAPAEALRGLRGAVMGCKSGEWGARKGSRARRETRGGANWSAIKERQKKESCNEWSGGRRQQFFEWLPSPS